MRKNGSASPKGSGAAGKARNPKKRAFSLPYISYNLHYTKYYKIKNRGPLLLRSVIGAGFGSLCCSFISFRLGRVDRLPSRHRKITAGQDRFHASAHCIRLYSGVSSGCVPKYAQIAS